MEREQIPVIGLQISLVAILVLGLLWVYGLLPEVFSKKAEFYIAFGALVVVLSPVLSQIIYSFWKIFFGFRSYDVTKLLCINSDQCEECSKIQIIFDNFWHNSDNVNENIIKYSRTRSVVCQMNLFASKILAVGSITYLIIALQKSLAEPNESISKALILFIASGLLACLFNKHFIFTSQELIATEKKYILIAKHKDSKSKDGFTTFYNDYFEITGKDLEEILK